MLFLRAPNHQLADRKNKSEFNLLFKLSNLNSNFALSAGYLTQL